MSDFAQIRFLPNRPLLRELSADRLNTILQEIKRNKPKGERGITVRQDGTGTYIGLAASLPRGGGGTIASALHPFQIFSRENPDNENQYIVTVRPGTINGVVPSNWDIEEEIAEDQLNYVILDVTAASNGIVSCEISLATTQPSGEMAPVQWGLPTEFSVVLGLVENGQVWQIVADNLSYQSSKRITTTVEAPGLGELPYANWYVWQQVP
jgi:hypothetical protein